VRAPRDQARCTWAQDALFYFIKDCDLFLFLWGCPEQELFFSGTQQKEPSLKHLAALLGISPSASHPTSLQPLTFFALADVGGHPETPGAGHVQQGVVIEKQGPAKY
jgi:hypothetical protein